MALRRVQADNPLSDLSEFTQPSLRTPVKELETEEIER